jgi:hypothetical protein
MSEHTGGKLVYAPGAGLAKRIATIVSFGTLLVVSREQLVVSRKQREQWLAAFAKWVH